LQTELNSLLATAHGELKGQAENIAKALDELVKNETNLNRKMFEEVINKAMTLPSSEYFKVADPEVKQAILNILEHAQEYLQFGLHGVYEKIYQEKKKLKERIKQIEEETGVRPPRPGRR